MKTIDLIVYDFDGVMTNNKVFVSQDGKEFVFCNRDDGWAIQKIKERGFPQLILSSEKNPVVMARALKLSIPCVSGCLDKKSWLIDFCMSKGYTLENVVYIGNGLNDLKIMRIVGVGIAPSDAHPDVIKIADYVTKKRGGEGVILEFLEMLKRGTISELYDLAKEKIK